MALLHTVHLERLAPRNKSGTTLGTKVGEPYREDGSGRCRASKDGERGESQKAGFHLDASADLLAFMLNLLPLHYISSTASKDPRYFSRR